MRSLILTWDTGELELELTSFFPCTISTFRKLLQVVNITNNSAEIKASLKDYCLCMRNYYSQEHLTSEACCQVLEGNIEVLWDCLAVDDISMCDRQLLLKDLKEMQKRLRAMKANRNNYERYVKKFHKYLDIMHHLRR